MGLATPPSMVLPPLGNDTFGARSTGQTFTPGVGVMPGAGGQAVLLVTEIEHLVVMRFVQALGGAAAAVLGRTMVRDLFDSEESAEKEIERIVGAAK